MAAVRHLILAENQSVDSRAVEQRRAQVRADLVAAAEGTVEREGLGGRRARSLAKGGGGSGPWSAKGCAVCALARSPRRSAARSAPSITQSKISMNWCC